MAGGRYRKGSETGRPRVLARDDGAGAGAAGLRSGWRAKRLEGERARASAASVQVGLVAPLDLGAHVGLAAALLLRALVDRAERRPHERRVGPVLRLPEIRAEEGLAAVAEDLVDLDVDHEPGRLAVDGELLRQGRVAAERRAPVHAQRLGEARDHEQQPDARPLDDVVHAVEAPVPRKL